jgi:hypothetical protein
LKKEKLKGEREKKWKVHTSARVLKENLVVETKTQLRHTTQVRLHLDSSNDFRTQQSAIGVDQKVNTLNDIQKDFVLTILDVLTTPVHSASNGNWRSRSRFQFVTLLSDEPFEKEYEI